MSIDGHRRRRQSLARSLFHRPRPNAAIGRDAQNGRRIPLVYHRPDVQRVIFIATPHRGSRFAAGWIGRIGSALVRTPRSFASIYASAKPLLIADPAASTLKRMPNSIDTLGPTIVSSNRSTSCRSRQTFPITRSLETVAGATHRIVRMASSRTGAPILMVRSRN